MGFLFVLGFSTLCIAGAAEYFSIYGLAQIFSGAFWPVVIMASALGLGKLVAASYVYKFWKHLKWTMKTYLISAILVLMLITSAGIFGFLTSAHMQGSSSLNDNNVHITLLDAEITQLQTDKQQRSARRQQIDAEVSNLPSNSVTGRQRLYNQYATERNKIDADLSKFEQEIKTKTTEINELKITQNQQQAHIGPILYIARALGKDVEDAVIWMTYLIMFAFDPLAVVLTIGFNMALERKRAENQITLAPTVELPSKHEPPVVVPEIQETYEVDEPDPSITTLEELVRTYNNLPDDDFVEEVQPVANTPEPIKNKPLPKHRKGFSAR